MQIEYLPVGTITDDKHSQRFEMNDEDLSELVSSISTEGLQEPIGVRRDDDHWCVVYGHRRLEACKRLGWEKVPCIIQEGSESQLRKKTFAENFFRKNLTPVEQAVAIADEIKCERMTVEQVADVFKRKPDWVRRQLAICGWPEDVLDAVHAGRLSVAAAENLAMITEDNYRKLLVSQAADNGATARTTAAWLQAWRSMLPPEKAIEQEPMPPGESARPLVPQTLCAACLNTFRTDGLSYLPICLNCARIIRDAAASTENL
jgi:ParB family chromosome partitioning protein